MGGERKGEGGRLFLFLVKVVLERGTTTLRTRRNSEKGPEEVMGEVPANKTQNSEEKTRNL